MLLPETLATVCHFRQELYGCLGHRQDSLFELIDAVLTSSERSPLVRLSLASAFRRGWPSTCDALSDGSVDLVALRSLFHTNLTSLALPAVGERPLWALDGTHWPRPAAATSPERTYERRVASGQPRDGVVPAWAYQWLVAAPEAHGSWVLPLDVRRREPTTGLPTSLAITQLQTALAGQSVDVPRPVVTLDTGYDVSALAQAHLRADLLVRLAKRRRLYRAPEPYSGRGRPCKHGAAFRLQDPTTYGPTDHTSTQQDPGYGRVQINAWDGLHDESAAADAFSVLCMQVEHLPRRAGAPAPLWLAWIGGPLPTDLLQVWRWYQRRFAIEHGFRFLKQSLGWTTVRLRSPQAADRWTWLLAAGLWQLWLVRPLVAEVRLPWDTKLAPEQLTPGRVRRAFGSLFVRLSSPTRAPHSRGKSPGRQLGQTCGPRQRFPVVRRTPANTSHRPRNRRHSAPAA
jgi:hypothetical protein